jgi:protein SMG9
LVVGVIGKQGVGKSTLLSLLAGNKFTDSNENMIFRPCGKDTRESAQNKTTGIQAYVTAERTILLDVQV